MHFDDDDDRPSTFYASYAGHYSPLSLDTTQRSAVFAPPPVLWLSCSRTTSPSTRREGLWTFRLPTLHSHSSAWFANPNKLNGAWYASHCILYHYVDATRRAVHPTHTMDVPCRVVFMPSASGLPSLPSSFCALRSFALVEGAKPWTILQMIM